MKEQKAVKLEHYKAIQRAFRPHEHILRKNKVLNSALQQFEGLLPRINDTVEFQHEGPTAVDAQKKVCLEELAEHSFRITSAILAHAHEQQNRNLLQKVRFSRSSFMQSNCLICVERSRLVNDTARNLLPHLKKFGIHESVLSTHSVQIARLAHLLRQKSGRRVHQEHSGEGLERLYAQCERLLQNQIDQQIERYRVSHPELYTAYRNARQGEPLHQPAMRRAVGVEA